MPDLTGERLPALHNYRLAELDLGDGFILPNYGRGSILNLPPTVCRLLGVPDFGAAPLDEQLLAPLGGPARRVILILMDALSLGRFQRWTAERPLPVWSRFAEEGVLAPLTSISPSTTSAAITALWTGRSAAQHGITGYEMWLKEYGIVANMIEHKPIAYDGDAGSLRRAGFDPEAFLPPPKNGAANIAAHLAAHGIATRSFQHSAIAHSGLSRMFQGNARIYPYRALSDLWVSVRQLLEASTDERLYVWVYWSMVDGLSHLFGPDDERVAVEFAQFTHSFEHDFLDKLSEAARRDTLVVLAADHGQIATAKDPHYDLKNHPNLARRLHIHPTGENRLAFLYIRPGQVEAVREYVERTWPNQFLLFDSNTLMHAGLFGPGTPHPSLSDRIGDLTMIAKGNTYLWWGAKENPIIGRHGGLSPDEMLVPFLAARL